MPKDDPRSVPAQSVDLPTRPRQRVAPAPTGRFRVVAVTAAGPVSATLPARGRVSLGRSQDNDLPIDDESVSRQHAVLHVGTRVELEDLGSVNGTTVAGRTLAKGERVPIEPGDEVALADVMLMLQRGTSTPRPRRFATHGYFEMRVEEECTRAARGSSHFALLRLHLGASDPQTVQQTLSAILRAEDVVGVYGPGEFEVLLPDTESDQCDEITVRIRESLIDVGIDPRIGVARFPDDGMTAEALLAHANDGAGETASGARGPVIVEDPAMRQIYQVIDRISRGSINVLLLGETGVGKEVVAAAVHQRSPRATEPYLTLNCAALSETLLESELFGHEKGAFTGAHAAKPGLLETADGGTVFLDEVGELPPSVQVKLLRVIEAGEVQRVGALQPRSIDVRFVSATNRDLEEEVERGTFRQDLFFRLNGVTLVIPPLRERLAEIAPLARAFIAESVARMGFDDTPILSDAALAMLESYTWPGNIREVRNVMERAVLLCGDGPIDVDHLPVEKMRGAAWTTPAPAGGADSDGIRSELEAIERQRIIDALEQCHGNQTKAATLLGMPRRTFVSRLDQYQIPRPRKKH